MGALYLVGVDHRDVHDGPSRFQEFCDKVKPTALLSEQSAEDFGKIQSLASGLEQRLGKSTLTPRSASRVVEEFYRLVLPFARFDTWQYAQRHGIPHHFADITREPDIAFQRATQLAEDFVTVAACTPERFSPQLFRHLRQSVHGEGVSPAYLVRVWEYYTRTERTALNELTLIKLRMKGLIGKRDRHMEQVVRSAYAPDATVVFPLGMVHAVDSLMKSTLYSRIKDLHPERILL